MELRLDAQTAGALAALRHDRNFQAVLAWLANQAQAARVLNDSELVLDVLRQRQGWIQAFAAFQSEVSEIESTVMRFRENR